MMEHETPKARYEASDNLRQSFLARCEQYAYWTIPSKFPRNYNTDSDDMRFDFQTTGARCTNNLMNKVMLALFAPSRPFFKPTLSVEDSDTLREEQGIDAAAQATIMTEIAKRSMRTLELMGARNVLIETIAQLIITGNALIEFDRHRKKFTLHTVRKYVTERNCDGDIIRFCLREDSKLEQMPQRVQDIYRRAHPQAKGNIKVTLYTEWRFEDEVWRLEQSIDQYPCTPENPPQYKDDAFPFRVLTWSLAPGRNYGTGLVEEAQGSFHGLSTLESAIVPGLTEMCRIVHFLNPASPTDATEFEQALSGSVLPGIGDDVFTPDMGGKSRDYATVAAKITEYRQDLSAMFLMATSMVRSAERVTAEEIRMIANELETALGGVYSRISTDLQPWLARIALDELDHGRFQGMDIRVITGLDALSANGDLDNIRGLIADLSNTQNLPEPVQMAINWDGFIQVLSGLHNVSHSQFLKSSTQVAAEQAAAQQGAVDQQTQLVAAEGMKEVAVNAAKEV